MLFGVSGLLYQRNALFFDRETDSLWSQLLSQAVTGPLAGTRLEILPAENTTWKVWQEAHPETLVLSIKTGYPRDYGEDPYAGYPMNRALALFVSSGDMAKIYPFGELRKAGSPVADRVGGREVRVVYDPSSQTARVEAADGKPVTFFVAFVDDLKAFYPGSDIFRASRRP